MEDKRTAIAVLLSILVILVYQRLMLEQRTYEDQLRPAALATPAGVSPTGSAAIAQGTTVSGGATTVQALPPGAAQAAPATPAELAQSPKTVVVSKSVSLVINHLGARLQNYRLSGYNLRLGSNEPYDLVQSIEGSPLPLGVHLGPLTDDHVQYTLESSSVQPVNGIIPVEPDQEITLRFTGMLPNGLGITKTFRLNGHSYLFHVSASLSAPAADGAPLWLEWTSFIPKDHQEDRYNLRHFVLLGQDGKIRNIPPTEILEGVAEYGANQWVSFGDTYFMSAIVAPTKEFNTKISRRGDSFSYRIRGTESGGEFGLYGGPKEYSNLKTLGFQLERSVDLGMFFFLAHPLLWLLKFFNGILGNWGLAIITLTLFIKALFLPLTQASLRSMKAMQDVQPEIKALRERIKDPTQLNQEILGLYKKRGVNPMGGCFPMLIQLPVFLGLYNALLNATELRHAPFALWIQDLSAPERFELFGIGIPIMILIMGASMLIQQWTNPSAADPAQKKAMMLMPFVFVIMFLVFPFPSGLVLYWLVNNIISIVQQVYLKREGLSSLHATIIGSLAIFAFGYILTLL